MYKQCVMAFLSCLVGMVLLVFNSQHQYLILTCLGFGFTLLGGMICGAMVLENLYPRDFGGMPSGSMNNYQGCLMAFLWWLAGGAVLFFSGQDKYMGITCLGFGITVIGGMFCMAVVAAFAKTARARNWYRI